MGFFNRKNKKFEYKPRYYDGEGNPYKITYKFDQFRSTTGGRKNLKSKILSAIDELKGKEHTVEYREEVYELEPQKSNTGVIIILAIVVMILIFLFIIDFDLSIFYTDTE